MCMGRAMKLHSGYCFFLFFLFFVFSLKYPETNQKIKSKFRQFSRPADYVNSYLDSYLE